MSYSSPPWQQCWLAVALGVEMNSAHSRPWSVQYPGLRAPLGTCPARLAEFSREFQHSSLARIRETYRLEQKKIFCLDFGVRTSLATLVILCTYLEKENRNQSIKCSWPFLSCIHIHKVFLRESKFSYSRSRVSFRRFDSVGGHSRCLRKTPSLVIASWVFCS
jgi:hypothetical protein